MLAALVGEQAPDQRDRGAIFLYQRENDGNSCVTVALLSSACHQDHMSCRYGDGLGVRPARQQGCGLRQAFGIVDVDEGIEGRGRPFDLDEAVAAQDDLHAPLILLDKGSMQIDLTPDGARSMARRLLLAADAAEDQCTA